MMARYYSPALGRFLSADPLVQGNRFTYVSNNPIAFIDPRGLFSAHADGLRSMREAGSTAGLGSLNPELTKYTNDMTLIKAGLDAFDSMNYGSRTAELRDSTVRMLNDDPILGLELASGDKQWEGVENGQVYIFGDENQRKAAKDELQKVFETPRGKEIQKAISKREKAVQINADHTGQTRTKTVFGVSTIQYNLNYMPLLWVMTPKGEATARASLTRLLAHELGHAVFGTPDPLANIQENENPVAEALGEYPRSRYELPEQ
jgi:hypothetical protein